MTRAGVLDDIGAAVSRRLADPEFVDLLADAMADRLVERLGLEPESEGETVDAATIADRFGLSRPTVYELAKRGAIPAMKVGEGPRPRWRFDPEAVAEALAVEVPESNGRRSSRRPRRPPSGVDLLPVKGSKP